MKGRTIRYPRNTREQRNEKQTEGIISKETGARAARAGIKLNETNDFRKVRDI